MLTGYLRRISLYSTLFMLTVTFSLTGGLAEGGIVMRSSGGKVVTNKSSDAEKQQKEKAKPAKPSERAAEPEKVKKETAKAPPSKPAKAAGLKKKRMTGLVITRGKGGVIVKVSSAPVSRPAAVKKQEKAEPEAAKQVKLSFITPGLEKLEGTWEIVEESDGKLTLIRPELKQVGKSRR